MCADGVQRIQNPNTKEWHSLERWIDVYTIGSEGGSAWAWRGTNPEAMTVVGRTGKTRQEAIEKVLEAIWEVEDE
jgi:hypothetical protein